jgi:YD repeat-containing protein
MTWATKWIWIAVLLAGGVQAGAYVNPIDQSLSVSHTDASGKSLKISRNFNSMRTKAGIFGSGWCSIWESSLKLKATGAEFNFCGMGKTIGFSNRGGRWISADTAYRFNADAKGYSVQMGFRDSFYFDKSGRLQSIQADATRFNISYAGGKIAIIEGAGEKAVFTFAGDRVATIQIGGETAAYTYAKENLTGVKRSSATAFAYSYNSHGQLTKIRGAQGSDELKYEYKGRAIASVEWKDCEEIISPNSSKPVTAVEVKKICKGKPPEIRTFAIKGVSRESGLTVNETEAKTLSSAHGRKTV